MTLGSPHYLNGGNASSDFYLPSVQGIQLKPNSRVGKMHANYWLLSLVATVGSLAIIISFFVLRREDKVRQLDHRARSLAVIGIALVSFCVAIGAYYLKEKLDLEHERRTASLSFIKAMFQFAISTRHLEDISTHCYTELNREACQESGALAVKFSVSLPSVEYTFEQVARGASSLYPAYRLAIYLIDADAALKGRMPILVEGSIGKIAATSGQRGSKDPLRRNIDDFRSKAQEMRCYLLLVRRKRQPELGGVQRTHTTA